MILSNINEIKDKNYNNVIIGSGPAGISLALKLEKKKIPVLIIEAGERYTSTTSQEFYEGNVYGDNYPDLSIARLRQLGGSSGHWGGICSVLDDYDFTGWPITKKDLHIYEDEAKKILDIDGDFVRTKFSNNFDYIGVLSSKVDFGEKYISHIKKSSFITLALNCTFLKLNFLNNSINNIDINFNGKIYKISSKNYILASGGLENSRLMLWSKLNNIKNFNQEMPIGNYYIDHPTHDVGEGVLDIKNFYRYLQKENFRHNISTKCDSWLYLSPNKNFIERNKLLNNRVDIYYKPFNREDYSKRIFKKLTCVAPNFIKDYLTKNGNLLDFRIEIHSDQEPSYNNKITLDPFLKDIYGIPRIKLFWKRSELIRETSKLTMIELGKLFVSQNIGRIGVKDFLFSNEEFVHKAGYHHMGGTRIGFNKTDSVVDRNLKVHGVNNLYICGSSIFRKGGSANPTFTIVQLSLRLGEYLGSVT
jgi:hypothetical protein